MATKSLQQGQAMIIAVLFLVSLSTSVIVGMSAPVVRDIGVAREATNSKKTYFLAEAAIEDAVYRLGRGMEIDAVEELTLNGESAQTVIADTFDGKTITSTGEVGGATRSIETKVHAGVGVAFNYGVQSGHGGVFLSNNAGVYGNVYSGGDITGSAGAFITGSAIAANSASLTSDQVNDTPTSPSSNVVFGNANATQDVAQSFMVSTSTPVQKVELYLRKVGTPGNATVRIVEDSAGTPGSFTIASGQLSSSLVTGSFGWAEVVFTSNPELDPGTTYWLVVDASTNSSRYYVIGGNTGYADGALLRGRMGSSWSATGLDGYFRLYLGGFTSTIHSVAVGADGNADAWAHTVTSSTVDGTIYCATGSGNNKSCDTSRPDPTPQALPVSDANIAEWKLQAGEGTTIEGDYAITASTVSLGPAKINGDLSVSNNATLIMTGTLWVTGEIYMANNVIVRLSPDYGSGSGVIVSDAPVWVGNNSTFEGSGTEGSYILLLTTSDCPASASCAGSKALVMANNAGAVILNAQSGTLSIANNAGAKEATGHLLELSNNSTVTYESGLANINFTSGPGGAFTIRSWKEIE